MDGPQRRGMVCLAVMFAVSCTLVFSGVQAGSSNHIILSGTGQCPPQAHGIPVTPAGCPRDSDGDGIPDYKDECPDSKPGTIASARGCETQPEITVRPSADKQNHRSTIINLINDTFDSDSADLKPPMKLRLNALAAEVLADESIQGLNIIGHTDSSGSPEYNQKLSERRAHAVADYLSSQGLSALNFSVSGNGAGSPLADNATAEGRARNRRVEIFTQTADHH